MKEQGIQTEAKPQDQPGSTWKAIGLFIFDFLKVFFLAVAIIIPIRWFLFQPFVVTGDSMRPNFHDGDYLIIDELTYRFRDPGRGEVVVLRTPHSASDFFIKRIVALPGERIVIENGHVTIYNSTSPQGIILEEKYLPNNNSTYGNIDRTLGLDEYFVLGDNRLSSSDSRIWGPLSRKDIVGRARLRVFSSEGLKGFQTFPSPSYNLSSP